MADRMIYPIPPEQEGWIKIKSNVNKTMTSNGLDTWQMVAGNLYVVPPHLARLMFASEEAEPSMF